MDNIGFVTFVGQISTFPDRLVPIIIYTIFNFIKREMKS